MNSKLLVTALVVVIGGGGLVLWQLFSTDTPDPDQFAATNNDDATPAEADGTSTPPLSGRGSLQELMARGESLECTIEYTPEAPDEASVEGTYFVSQERMRGDFLTSTDGEEYLASMIVTDDTLYTWSEVEGETYGMQIDLSTFEETANETDDQPDTREPVPMDEDVRYDCKTWSNVDATVFVPPADITFIDYSDVLQGGMEYGTVYEEAGESADQCASCEQIPDAAAREQCLTALGCE